MVTLHLLAEYGLYVLIRFDTFTTAIYDQFQSTFSGPTANMLAGVPSLFRLFFLTLEGTTRGKARYARVGSGSPREQHRLKLNLPLNVMWLLFSLAVVVPLAVLCHWLWLGWNENWTQSGLWLSLCRTMVLGAGGALLIMLNGIPVTWLTVRYPRAFCPSRVASRGLFAPVG